MRAPRHRPDIVDRAADVARRGLEQGREIELTCDVGHAPRPLQVEAERHQALLCTVVQVPFDTTPGRVARPDDPGPRSLHFLQLRRELLAEPADLERESDRGGDWP